MEFSLLCPELRVSKICLGTMTFGEQNSYKDAVNLLNMAAARGVNFFDTAEMYPVPQRAHTQGRSEVYLGRWMKECRIPRDKIVVATKVSGPSGQMSWIRGGPHSLDRKNVKQAIDSSLQRLGTDYIDLYQIHWPDRYVPMFGEVDYDPSRSISAVPFEEQLDALADGVASGKIKYVGVSNETAYGLSRFCSLAQQRSHFPRIISLQNAYNLLCRTFDAALAECCHQERVSLLAYSPLAMGLLTGKYLEDDGGPPNSRLNLYRGRYAEAECRYNLNKANLVPAVQSYMNICQRHGLSPVTLAIGFVMQHPLLGSVVVGATTEMQLEEILKAAINVKLSPEVVNEINLVHQRYPNPAP